MHILFHRPTPWSSSINCSTKIYTRLFAEEGYQVSYLQANIHLFHRLLKKGYYHVWNEGERFDQGVWVCGGLSLLPYTEQVPLKIPSLSAMSYRWCIPSLRKVVLRSGFREPDLIWTTVPGSSSLKTLFPKAKLVFHSIDNYSAFQGSGVEKILAKDYERADHIFVIGESLKQDIMTTHGIDRSKITNLGQGVDLGGYKGMIDPPKDLQGVQGPIAIWVGVLKKLDIDYLKAVLTAMQKRGGTVVLIGPVVSEFERLAREYDNLLLLGSRNADQIPAYLSQADIGLMIYDRKKQDVYRGQHPLKLYEYAAAGLPIISTWHQEFEYLKPPIINLKPGDDMDRIVDDALSSDQSFRNSIKEFARDHSWERCKDIAIKTLLDKGLITNDMVL